jgi:DNA adenine methylase
MTETNSLAPHRPALAYLGGKWAAAPWVLKHFPPHRVYVEAFGGGGSVLMRKEPAKVEVYNDLDEEVVEFFRVLRDPLGSRELLRGLRRTPYSRSELLRAYQHSDNAVERARRLAVRSMMAFHPDAIFFTDKTFQSGSGKRNLAANWRGYVHNLPRITARLRDVIIENKDAVKVLRQFDGPAVLHYVDPPYVRSTRASDARYRHEMNDAQHLELLATLRSLAGFVVLSGYDSALYSEQLANWKSVRRPFRMRSGGRLQNEVLWLSPQTAEALTKK